MEVDFIVVDFYLPYITIMAWPWLYALGAVSSTLHQEVKHPSHGQVKEIIRSQFVAMQCMVATILHRPNVESLASSERNLYQSKTLTSTNNELAEGSECEDLEKVTVGDDQ